MRLSVFRMALAHRASVPYTPLRPPHAGVSWVAMCSARASHFTKSGWVLRSGVGCVCGRIRGAFAQNTLILEDQLDPTGRPRRRWKLANLGSRRPLLHGELSCPCSSRVFDFRVKCALCSSPSWPPNYALLETGADMVVQYQGARTRRAIGTRAVAPGHVVNMLTDEYRTQGCTTPT